LISVAEECDRASFDWSAQYRLDPDAPWSSCRLLDVTLVDAAVALDDVPTEVVEGQEFSLQIESIAADDVGIRMGAVVREVTHHDAGAPTVRIEFRAGREEQLLLHLLVRLHALV